MQTETTERKASLLTAKHVAGADSEKDYPAKRMTVNVVREDRILEIDGDAVDCLTIVVPFLEYDALYTANREEWVRTGKAKGLKKPGAGVYVEPDGTFLPTFLRPARD